MAPIGSKWPQMAPNGSKLIQMAPNAAKWLQGLPIGRFLYSRISFVFQNGPTSNRRGKPKMTSPPANHRSSDGPTSNQRPVGFQLFRSSPEVGLYSVAFPEIFERWMGCYAACDWLRERPPSTHQPIITCCVGLGQSAKVSTVFSDHLGM